MSGDATGDGSNDDLSTVQCQEKGSRNKRKFLSDVSLDTPVDLTITSLIEFPRYEPEEKIWDGCEEALGSVCPQVDESCNEQKVEEFQRVDWDDPVAYQLEELLSDNLFATFRSSMKRIVECGYDEKVAEWVVLNSGIYHGGKNVVSNIVDGCLALLRRGEEYVTSRGPVFKDLQSLVEYTMLEMIHVLREVRPLLTVAEAMWCLLISDLNLLHACEMEGEPLSGSGKQEAAGEIQQDATLNSQKHASETSHPNSNKPQNLEDTCPTAASSLSQTSNAAGVSQFPKSIELSSREVVTTKESSLSLSEAKQKLLGLAREHVQALTQAANLDEKSGGYRKGPSANSKRDMLRQKPVHFDKSYKARMAKGAIKAKVAAWGSMVLDKTLKSQAGTSSSVSVKASHSKVTGNSSPLEISDQSSKGLQSGEPATGTTGGLPVKDTVFALPAVKPSTTASAAEPKPTSLNEVNNSCSSKVVDYFAGIPYDESLKEYVPQDEKDKAILMLVPHMQALEKELQGWTDWANDKVMQVAQRLGKDKAELKTLRQEKEEAEKFKKDKQTVEENTMKRLSEMENALSNATAQMEVANNTLRRLEKDNFMLKREMEAAKLRADGSANNLKETKLREQEALKKLQSWDTEKGLLQEQITHLKHQVAELLNQLEKAKRRKDQIEGLWQQEHREVERTKAQVDSLREKREKSLALTKAAEDNMKQMAEEKVRKCNEDIKKLENELSALKIESEASKIAALRRGIDGSCLTDRKNVAGLQGVEAPMGTDGLARFQGSFEAGSVRREMECVMCLTEEMSVVFLPCAHQVLCVQCNSLHEKQGMNDCPSCRSKIQNRIPVHFPGS